MDKAEVARIVEMGLLCSSRPCTEKRLQALFDEQDGVSVKEVRAALDDLAGQWSGRAVALKRSAGGWQLVSAPEHKERLRRFLESSPPRLGRAMTEVLAIVAYHQPVTRGDIEKIRGVSTSASQLAYLEELGWVEASGRRDTPGRPIEYSTSGRFLDDLGLRELGELPDLGEFVEDDAGYKSNEAPGQGDAVEGRADA